MGLSGNRIPKIVQLCLSSCSQKSSLLERQLISWDIHHFQTHPINGTLSIHLPFIRWVGQNQLDHLEDSGRSIPPKEPEVISCVKMHIIYIYPNLANSIVGRIWLTMGFWLWTIWHNPLLTNLDWSGETGWKLLGFHTSQQHPTNGQYMGQHVCNPNGTHICCLTTFQLGESPVVHDIVGSLSGSSLHCRDSKNHGIGHRLTSPLVLWLNKHHHGIFEHRTCGKIGRP